MGLGGWDALSIDLRPERALLRSKKYLCWPERSLCGLRGPTYGLPSERAPFRPARAICRCGRACAALRGQFFGLRPKWALFRPKRAIYRCGRACAALRGLLVNFRSKKFLCCPEGPCAGQRGPSYGLPSKLAPFGPRGQSVGVEMPVLL